MNFNLFHQLLYIDPGTGGFIVGNIIPIIIGVITAFFGLIVIFFKKIFNFFKKHTLIFIILLVVLLIIIITVIGVFILSKESDYKHRIIILGFDGLSPHIIDSLIDQGKLPNLTALKETGTYTQLSTTNPAQSPVAWTGFSTGQNPGKTGVFDFIKRDPATYKLTLSMSQIRGETVKPATKSKRLWFYTSKKKLPTTIISCPVTFPPDKVYNGNFLSGMGVPDILGTQGTFSFYTTRKDRTKDVGGNVFQINKSDVMVMNILGPRKIDISGKSDFTKIPFKVALDPRNNETITITLQDKTSTLKLHTWSDWQEVIFDLGFLKKVKAILKFYFVENDDEFSLYASALNFDPTEPFLPISSPKSYSKELKENIGFFYTLGMPMDTWAVNEGRLSEEPFIEQVNDVLKEKTEILEYELKRFETGLLYCYFESPDIMQHMFWRYRDRLHPLYESNDEYSTIIESWYEKMDNILGGVMRRIHEGDTIIVLSDHGFDTFRRSVHVNTWLRKNGYLQLKNPQATSGGELLTFIDWSKTKAYAVGFGSIYLNVKGREKEGIVEPGAEAEALKKEISRKLSEWTDPKYDEMVIHKVYKNDEIFRGEYQKETPDLFIGFNSGYRASWQTALGAVPKDIIEDNLKKWSGTHLIDPSLVPGIFFSNRIISTETPSIYDITPSVLKLIGYTDEELQKMDMDGQPLFEEQPAFR
ncbi:MAG: alkaline phosphatase family protein [Spirochaetales bacterium]|nr:alkaline phosphatase family protein [Spirochaetales bacterium]